MNNLALQAKTRLQTGKKNIALRKQGELPAVLYGRGFKNINLSISNRDFHKIYEQAGESTLVDLIIDDKKPIKILIHDVQFNPVKDEPIHVDFLQVNMSEKIEAEIELEFIGVSPAVKDLGGVVVTNIDKISVKCFPQDLVSKIQVDLSVLKTFDDHVFIKNLAIPDKMEVLDNPEEVVVGVTPPRSEEELKELEQKPEEVKEAEVIGEKKLEEGAEGEAGEKAPAKETPTEEKKKEEKKK